MVRKVEFFPVVRLPMPRSANVFLLTLWAVTFAKMFVALQWLYSYELLRTFCMMIYDSRIIRCNVGTVSSNKQEIEQKYVRNRFHVVGNL